jgi:hypothetical protein
MNDTETRARHLLAAASEDRPPGIDLLGGFAAVRRRDQSRRTRRRTALTAGIAVAAASIAAVILMAGSAPPALAMLTSALTRTLTQSHHVSEQDSYYSVVNGQIRNLHRYTCTIETDPVRHLEAATCPGNYDFTYREVGGYIYYYSPVTTATHGKHWWRELVASLPPPPCCIVDDFIGAAPQKMLAEIKAGATVTVAGSASGPGWTGTRYAFRALIPGGTTLSGTVTVDQQGRARELVLTTRMPKIQVTKQVLTFSDFGVPVTVTPPPADQTYFAS